MLFHVAYRLSVWEQCAMKSSSHLSLSYITHVQQSYDKDFTNSVLKTGFTHWKIHAQWLISLIETMHNTSTIRDHTLCVTVAGIGQCNANVNNVVVWQNNLLLCLIFFGVASVAQSHMNELIHTYGISQEICTRFLLCCALLWLYIDWFSHIHQAYFTGTVAI